MKKEPAPVDKHVGARIRMRRMMLEMSQTDIAQPLGLTFQQVQKYERGTNRIGSSRLAQIAKTLGVPVSFFFEGLGGETAPDAETAALQAFMTSPEGMAVAKAFMILPDVGLIRWNIVKIVQDLAACHGTTANEIRRAA